MNNSSDQGDNIEEDIAFISRAYQATDKSNPPPSLDENILKMAQERIQQKAKTFSKPISLRWWENQHYHGAIAASVLVFCLVYILPTSTTNMQTDNPIVAEISEPQLSPIALSEIASGIEQEKSERKKSEQQARQVEQRIAFSSSEAIDSAEPTSLRLSRATTLSNDEVTANFNAESAPSKLSADTMTRSVFATKEEQVKNLITQNETIIKDLLKLQTQTNMTHQQIINEAITAKQAPNIESEGDSPIIGYLKQQSLMQRNLEQILKVDSNIDVANNYKDVLSSQEMATFLKIAAEAPKPE